MMRQPPQRATVRPMTPWTRVMVLVVAASGLALAACNRPAPAAPPREEGVPGFPALLREQRPYDAFNGIAVEEFEFFYRDWNLVTARYRTDRNQQRVVFANPIAWRALMEGRPTFPNGSMFAKATFEVGMDPRFPSSKMPGAQLRVMLMKREFARYPNTDGWGYALLNRFGTALVPGEAATQVEPYQSIRNFEVACHACHKLVAATDYVFSEPMFRAVLQKEPGALPLRTLRASFQTPTAAQEDGVRRVAAALKDLRAPPLTAPLVLEMPLFEGSLPELRGAMANLTADEKQSFMVLDPETGLFAVSQHLPPNDACFRRELYRTGCLAGEHIPARNRAEVTTFVTLCNGQQDGVAQQ